jgi:NitT/TauT family transport system substrate-binding protein
VIANDLAKRREVYDHFLRAYRDVIDFMYADPKAIEAFAKSTQISPAMAQTVRDRFYPKAMLQLDEVKGLDEMMQDAIAFQIHHPAADAAAGERAAAASWPTALALALVASCAGMSTH